MNRDQLVRTDHLLSISFYLTPTNIPLSKDHLWEETIHYASTVVESVVLSGLEVILCDPIPWGHITTPEGNLPCILE